MNEEIQHYRERVLQAVLEAKDKNGNQRMSEQEAHDLLGTFTDDQLADGMAFVSPEEMAELMING